jgi:hypothetical protein
MKNKNYLTIFLIIMTYAIIVLILILHFNEPNLYNCNSYCDFSLIHFTKDGYTVINSNNLESLLEKAYDGDKIKCNVNEFRIETIIKNENHTDNKIIGLTYDNFLNEFTVNIKDK